MFALLEFLLQSLCKGVSKTTSWLHSLWLIAYRRFKSTVKGEAYPQSSTMLELLFPKMQIEWKESEFKCQEDERAYDFTFQGGHFVAVCSRRNTMVSFYYPYFVERPLGALTAVRHASNEFNSLAVANFATYYIIDAQGHQVYLYMRFGMPIDSTKRSVQEMLAAQLEATFAHVRRTRAELEKIEASDDNNLEENTAISERLNVLSHVAEMNYAPALAEGFETKEQKHTVGEVLSTFLPNEEPVTLLRMEGVLTGEGDCEPSTIEVLEAEEMKNFPFVEYLMTKGTTFETLKNSALTLVISVSTQEGERKDCLLHVLCESETNYDLFFRVTFTRPTGILLPQHSAVVAKAEQQSSATTFVLAYDKVGDGERRKEFEYFWNETRDALERGEDLTEAQDEMMACTTPYYGYCMYWGRRFYASERYYEALAYFKNVFRWLSPRFSYMNKGQRAHFFELLFSIGSCYSALGLYQQAYYYLDGLYSLNNHKYNRAYVNALVNGHDFRALFVIDRYLDQEQKQFESEGTEVEEPERQAFVRFLKRRRGTALIDADLLDEAEQQFQALLEFPDSEGIALEELLRIQQIRNDKEENTQPTDS